MNGRWDHNFNPYSSPTTGFVTHDMQEDTVENVSSWIEIKV